MRCTIMRRKQRGGEKEEIIADAMYHHALKCSAGGEKEVIIACAMYHYALENSARERKEVKHMKKKSLFGGLLLAGALSVGSLSTAFAGVQVGVPYVADEAQAAEPGAGSSVGQELPPEQQAAKDVLEAAMTKTNETDSYHVTGTMNMEMTVQGQKLSMQMPMDVQYEGLTSGNPKFIMTTSMEMNGQAMPMTFFYTDGYYYMDVAGQKMKMAMDLNAAIEQAKGMTGINVTDSTAAMSNFNLVENNGIRTVYYTYDASALNEVIQTAMAAQMDIMNSAGMNMDLQVTKCVGEASVNGAGYLVNERLSMDFAMDMSYEQESEQMAFHIFVGIDYQNPGQPVSITLPSTEGFTEISADLSAGTTLNQAQ